MTVQGDELVYNCRNCFSQHGFGIALKRLQDDFECPHCRSRYVAQGGFMKKVG